MCGFLDADADEQDLAVLADTDAPLLVLVDYAETRTEQLRRLLPLLWEADTGDPVRVLLLARAAGDWWAGLARELDGEPGEVTALGALDPVEDRAAAVRHGRGGLRRAPRRHGARRCDWRGTRGATHPRISVTTGMAHR